METPAMLEGVGKILRVRLATCAQCDGFLGEDVIERVKASLDAWERGNDEAEQEEEAPFGSHSSVCSDLSDKDEMAALVREAFHEDELGDVGQRAPPSSTLEAKSQRSSPLQRNRAQHKNAWVVFGEYCLVETLCSFVEAQLACIDRDPMSPDMTHELLIFQTDSVHRAMGIVGTSKPVPAKGHFDPDWARLKQSRAITLNGTPILDSDIEVTELLFDVACRLGLPCDAPLSEQEVWFQGHTLAMHWLARLLYQGSLAQLWYILGSCLFGASFPMQVNQRLTN